MEGKYFSINSQNVLKFGETFSNLKPNKNLNELITPVVNSTKEKTLFAFLLASSICHSTQGGLNGVIKNKRVKGWDYLLSSFCCAAEDNNFDLTPASIINLGTKTLYNILTDYSIDTVMELDDIDRRAEILRLVSHDLINKYNGSVFNLLTQCNNKVGGESGAYSRLSEFSAFSDELRKKSTAFLMTVHFSTIWKIIDHENVEPMIDYHRMRLFLRTGCIFSKEIELTQKLKNREIVEEEKEREIRLFSANICKEIVNIFNLSMFDFDIFFWSHARSCCRNHPLCISKRLENDSFYSYIEKEFNGMCELESWCPGKISEEYRTLWEPMLNTENY